MSVQSSLNFPVKKKLPELTDKCTTPKTRLSLSLQKKKETTPSAPISQLHLSTPSSGVKKSRVTSARKALHFSQSAQLPCREEEIQKLEDFIGGHLKNESSGSMYISGLPGTGKTASLHLVMNQRKVSESFKKVFINCTTVKTASAIYRKICEELKIEVPSKGRVDKIALVAITNFLVKKHKMILLVLDEIDQLACKNQSVLYNIFEWTSIPKARLVLIGIANAIDLTDRTLPRVYATLPDPLQPIFIHFKPYDKDQIVTILKHRLSEAGETDLFAPGALELLSAKVAVQTGDIRRALDLAKRSLDTLQVEERCLRTSPRKLYCSPVKKEKENDSFVSNSPIKEERRSSPRKRLAQDICPSPKKIAAVTPKKQTESQTHSSPRKKLFSSSVTAKDVLSVVSAIHGSVKNLIHDESVFPLHQKLLICSLLLAFKGRSKDINIGKLHEIYSRVCKNRGITPVDQSTFVGLCRQVEVSGALHILNGKKGPQRMAKLALQWDEGEIAEAIKDTTLLASILADTSCLSK